MMLVVWVGIAIAVWLAARRAALRSTDLAIVVLVLIASAWTGARLYSVLQHPASLALSQVWSGGGFGAYGSVCLAVPCVVFTLRRRRLPVASTLDAFAPSLSVAMAIAKLGCLIGGCCYGEPTRLPLYVLYGPNSPAGDRWPLTPLFPIQLLESILAGVVLATTLLLGRSRAPGLVFATWLLGFGASRTAAGFLRSYETEDWVRLGGHAVPLFQLVGAVFALAGLAAIILVSAAAQREAPAPEGTVASVS